jgi:TetR/AcrR family transcriptional regulator, transcriptional repressor for nem operon
MARKDTKTAIMDTAQELIQRRGANAMSYQDISEAVGIRKASIHHHFPAKDDLIQAVIERYAEYVFGLMDEIFASKLDPAAKLRKYAALFEATLSDGRRDKACPFAILGAELSSLGGPAAARVRRFYRDSEERLARVVEEGRGKGQFHFKGDAKRVAAMFFALLEGAMLIARAEGGPKRLHAMAEQALKLLQE